MNRKMVSLFALVLSIGFVLSVPEAEAKRLGGGSSSGMKRDSSVMKREAAPTPSAPSQSVAPKPAAPAPAPAPAPSGMGRFLGPLAGLAAGIGIASLLSHFGMGGLGAGFSAIIMMLLIGVVVFFIIRMLMSRRTVQAPADSTSMPLQYAGAGAAPVQQTAFETLSPVAGSSATAANIPPGFDVEGFVRQAKLNFVRLQAANDAGNMDDVRAFTTPEMFAEIQLEYQERGKAVQQTDVVQLNAGLLDVSTEGNRQIASVRFYGSIRESAAAAPEAFDEVWHLIRPVDGSSGWVIAGIQQSD